MDRSRHLEDLMKGIANVEGKVYTVHWIQQEGFYSEVALAWKNACPIVCWTSNEWNA